jgi:hypothetical protein
LDGPYEPTIGVLSVVLADCAAFSEPVVAWHILIASIWQLPAAAGDICILAIFICGASAVLLEHAADQIAIAAVIVSNGSRPPFCIVVIPPCLRLRSI